MLKWSRTENCGGETEKGGLRLGFDTRSKLEFHGAKITSEASIIVLNGVKLRD